MIFSKQNEMWYKKNGVKKKLYYNGIMITCRIFRTSTRNNYQNLCKISNHLLKVFMKWNKMEGCRYGKKRKQCSTIDNGNCFIKHCYWVVIHHFCTKQWWDYSYLKIKRALVYKWKFSDKKLASPKLIWWHRQNMMQHKWLYIWFVGLKLSKSLKGYNEGYLQSAFAYFQG